MNESRLGFGALLSSARQAAGLSQSELARRAGVRPEHISRLEGAGRGKAPTPHRSTVEKLADALELPPLARGDFLRAAGYEPPGPLQLQPVAADRRAAIQMMSDLLESAAESGPEEDRMISFICPPALAGALDDLGAIGSDWQALLERALQRWNIRELRLFDEDLVNLRRWQPDQTIQQTERLLALLRQPRRYQRYVLERDHVWLWPLTGLLLVPAHGAILLLGETALALTDDRQLLELDAYSDRIFRTDAEPLFRAFRTGRGTAEDLERRRQWDQILTHAGYDGPPRPRLLKKEGLSTVLFPEKVWKAAADRRAPAMIPAAGEDAVELYFNELGHNHGTQWHGFNRHLIIMTERDLTTRRALEDFAREGLLPKADWGIGAFWPVEGAGKLPREDVLVVLRHLRDLVAGDNQYELAVLEDERDPLPGVFFEIRDRDIALIETYRPIDDGSGDAEELCIILQGDAARPLIRALRLTYERLWGQAERSPAAVIALLDDLIGDN